MNSTNELPEDLYPAIHISTQTTIPLLSQILAGFSIALIPISITSGLNEFLNTTNTIDTKTIAIICFGLSAFFFWSTTESCINSQSWDYFILSEKYLKHINLSGSESYLNKCIAECEHWHTMAAVLYRIGLLLIVVGVMFLLWPYSHNLIIGATIFIVIFLSILILYKSYRVRKFYK